MNTIFKKDKINNITKVYLLVYCVVLLLYNLTNQPMAWGEFDDYTLPVASILNDGNCTINSSDVDYYKELFPELSSQIEEYSLSGYEAKNGSGELTWYYPTYAIICLPMVVLFRMLGISSWYAFPFVNIMMLMILLGIIYKYCKTDSKKKLLVILAFSINPIIFYLPWLMAEVTIYVFMALSMVCWYNGWNKRAAVFLSLAGTLNVTAMSVGFLLIFDYFINLYKSKECEEDWLNFIKKNVLDVIEYGSCYIIGIIPMIYNWYNTGNINLTASYSSFTVGKESILQRFMAYLFDLNYGLLPYYIIILILSLVFLFISIRKKHLRYIELFFGFILNVFCYSVMVHINCGGSGIGRYNSWGVVTLLAAVVFYFDELTEITKIKRIMYGLIGIHYCMVLCILFRYGPYGANNTWGEAWMPIARYVLDYAPFLYNPLGSTFYANTNNIIGGYDYDTPVIYCTRSGDVRKILATQDDIDELKNQLVCVTPDDDIWFKEKIWQLSKKERYISIPLSRKIYKCANYKLGTEIYFDKEKSNSDQYIINGIYDAEEWGAWSDSKIFMTLVFDDKMKKTYQGTVKCGVYDGKQKVVVYVNDNIVFDNIVTENDGGFCFEFECDGVANISIEMPNAKECSDGRIIALSIGSMIFEGR